MENEHLPNFYVFLNKILYKNFNHIAYIYAILNQCTREASN